MAKVSKVIVNEGVVGFEISFTEYKKYLMWKDAQLKRYEEATKNSYKKISERKLTPAVFAMEVEIAYMSAKRKYPITISAWLEMQGVK